MKKLIFLLLFTVSIGRAQSTRLDTMAYWSTISYENFDYGILVPTNLPWGKFTHLIMYTGHTLGALTNATYPFFQCSSIWETDAYHYTPAYHIADSLRLYRTTYHAFVLIDLGSNENNEYTTVCGLGDTAIARWASTVGHYIKNFNWDGADFNATGGTYPTNGGMGKMAHFLKDTLTAISPGRTFYITASVNPNAADVAGYGIVSGIAYFNQVNPMFFDVSGTFASPLYLDPNCATWSSDSAVAQAFVTAGVPKAKVGLGYAAQAYHTNSTVACPPGGFGYIDYLSASLQYFPPATGATAFFSGVTKESYVINTVAGVKIAFDDTLSSWFKGDFIKRQGYGGAYGFCVGRGHLASTTYQGSHDPAIAGMGNELFYNTTPSPPTPPPIPTLSSPAQGATGVSVTPTLSWNASSGATSYEAQVSIVRTFASLFFDKTGIAGTSQAISGLSNSTKYYWRVNATGSGGTSAFSIVDSFTTVAPVPGVPTLSTPANNATGVAVKPTFTWAIVSASPAPTYQIQVSTSSGFGSTAYDTSLVVGTSATMTASLSNNTIYFWHVRSNNTNGTSAYSTTFQFTTIQASPPSPTAPTLATPADSATLISLTPIFTWNAGANATKYRIQVSSDTGFATVVWDDSSTAVLDTLTSGLTTATKYWWHVRSQNSAGNSAYSTRRMFTTLPAIPPAPTLSAPSNAATGVSITPAFSWLASVGAASYELQIGSNTNFDTLIFDQTGIQALVDTALPLAYSKTFYWRVRATNTSGTGAFSSVFSFTTTTAPVTVPSAPTLGGPANGSTVVTLTPVLTWGAVSGATSYRVQIALNSTFAPLPLVMDAAGIAGPSAIATGLANDVTYYWRVNATNVAGTSAWSGVFSFITPPLTPQPPAGCGS